MSYSWFRQTVVMLPSAGYQSELYQYWLKGFLHIMIQVKGKEKQVNRVTSTPFLKTGGTPGDFCLLPSVQVWTHSANTLHNLRPLLSDVGDTLPVKPVLLEQGCGRFFILHDSIQHVIHMVQTEPEQQSHSPRT